MIKEILNKIKSKTAEVDGLKVAAILTTLFAAIFIGFMALKPEPVNMGYSVATGFEKNIRASITSVQTTIPVTSLELKDGTSLDISLLGGKVFLTLEPGNNTREEIIMCEGINTTTISFTSCTRGLAFSGTSTAGIAANQKSHSAGSKVVMSNVHYVYEQYADVNNKDQTLAGNKTWTGTTLFYGFPVVSSTGYTGLPTTDGQLASKYYVDTVGAGGFTSVNVSTTRGLSVDGSSPEKVGINASSTTGMGFDLAGKLYQAISGGLAYVGNAISLTVTSLISGGVATTTPIASMIPVTDSSGLLDSFITPAANTKSNFTVGEYIASGKAVYVSSGTSTVQLYSSAYTGGATPNFDPYTLVRYGQTFTTTDKAKSLSSVMFQVDESWGGNSYTGTVSIYATAAGVPTGAALWTSAYTRVFGAGCQSITVYPNLTVVTSTMYAFVVTADNYSGTNQTGACVGATAYSGGTWVESADNGITYSTVAKDFASSIMTVEGQAGGVYLTTALTNVDRANNFLGFAAANINTSSVGSIITSGIANVFTGLTPGATYYLSDTFGAISTASGTEARKIGLSVSSTAILIKSDNP